MLLLVSIPFVGAREITQAPYHHGSDQDSRGHLLQILLALLPCMAPDGLSGRDTVRRKLHHERQVVFLDEAAEDGCRQYGEQYSEEIDPQQRHGRAAREEGPCKQDEDREPACARHERNYGYGYQPALPTLYRPGCHYCRHVAPESHDHRDEGFAVKAYPVHQAVHDECRTRHIPRVFHD